jgi:hypothetical protein
MTINSYFQDTILSLLEFNIIFLSVDPRWTFKKMVLISFYLKLKHTRALYFVCMLRRAPFGNVIHSSQNNNTVMQSN